MQKQHIHIPKYDWDVNILYNVDAHNIEYVADELYALGCPMRDIRKAVNLLATDYPNQGLTYSDKIHHETLIVVGYASSIGEFANTLVHEVDHCVDHISQVFGIPYDSEENSYLIGGVAELICEGALNHFIKNVI